MRNCTLTEKAKRIDNGKNNKNIREKRSKSSVDEGREKNHKERNVTTNEQGWGTKKTKYE